MKNKVLLTVIVWLIVPLTSFCQDVQQNQSNQTNPEKIRELGLVFNNFNSFGIRYKYGYGHTLFRITSLVLNGSNTQTNYTNYNYNANDPNYPSTLTDANLPKNSNTTVGCSLNFGFETRKHINDKFYIYYGLELINTYSYSKSNSTTPNPIVVNYTDSIGKPKVLSVTENNNSTSSSWTISSGLGVIFGMGYSFSKSFKIAVEIEPNVSYKYGKSTNSNLDYSYNYNYYSNNTPYIINDTSTQTVLNKGFSYGLSIASANIIIAYRF